VKKFEIFDLKSFRNFVKSEIVPLIKPQTLFLLSGEMGVGKTELVKTVAAHFGMQDVQSPTFAFHHIYQSEKIKLHHVDLFRLKNEEDLDSTGFWDLFENENDTLFVEWSNLLLADAWPWSWSQIQVEIKKLEGEKREVSLKIPNA
jgi:tRNA threonylcarbamoyladenosine biosynthesis protein TsaE